MNSYTDTKLIKPIRSYAFVFVCQKGKLEIEAAILAATLKRFLKCRYQLIAAIPGPEAVFGKPDKKTIKLLKSLGVSIQEFTNDIVSQNPHADFSKKENKTKLYANKIYCLGVKTDADKLIFLDSDMLLHKDFTGDTCFSIPFNARLAKIGGSITANGLWEKLYNLNHATMPALRIRRNRIKEKHPEFTFTPPYFNAGFVAIRTELAQDLFATWKKCYQKILNSKIKLSAPVFTEQIALSIAIHKMGIPYNILEYEYPNLPFFHYGATSNLIEHPKLKKVVQTILNTHPHINEMIKRDNDWNFLSND